MKKHLTWLPLVLITLFSSAAVSTNAQSAHGVRANVPFDFTVGDKTFQAGKIVAALPGSEAGPMAIRNINNGQHTLRIARTLRGADASDSAKLVFRKYGNRYFLAEVWVPGLSGWEVMKSRSERAIERELRLARNSKPELVSVSADTQ
jgi:hypothetical protein